MTQPTENYAEGISSSIEIETDFGEFYATGGEHDEPSDDVRVDIRSLTRSVVGAASDPDDIFRIQASVGDDDQDVTGEAIINVRKAELEPQIGAVAAAMGYDLVPREEEDDGDEIDPSTIVDTKPAAVSHTGPDEAPAEQDGGHDE